MIVKIVLTTVVLGAFLGLVIDLYKQIQLNKVAYLKNDLSNDYTRWEASDLAIAAFVGLVASKEVRLSDEFQAVIYAVLKRSERAVDEKIRRVSTIGSEKSDASVADQDAAFLVLSYEKSVAKDMFELDLQVSGASNKQIETLMSYL
jgi:hypothetical protein